MKASAVGTRFFVLLVLCLLALPAVAQEPQWIWSSAHQKNNVPAGDCFFRKSFDLKAPEMGEIQITADNRFELFVNDQPVGRGEDWRQLQVYDISKHLRKGRNCVAVKVTNTDVGSAGLVARVLIKENGGTFESYSTNQSWKTSVRQYQSWANPDFPDREWIGAKSYGALNATLPWGDEIVFAGEGSRFKIGEEFTVERLMRDDEVGSLIAMTFDAQGNILASREGGHLMLLSDSDGNGTHDTVGLFSDKIKNVQGILAIGTRVFAIGDGPQGVALYRLRDADRDGVAEEIKALVPIRGSRGEHGAHAVRLGPDGMLYVIVGDHARVGLQAGPRSPYRNAYEGDLIQPRQEDPQGHAVGIPAPGGTIFRTDAEGSFVELVAGGLRNSYDFAFNEAGELFTYDADMEWDMGAPWYRPTRVLHVTAGAELGWRSGWAKWPSYYLDSLPAAINLGAGSPTGVEFYNHTAFPERYRGAMFGCDWATGKIICVRFERKGATYSAQSEVFVEGRPLNVTDLAVGPDGSLYFCTGGRGTDGGVYRIRWTADQPNSTEAPTDIATALRQPQLEADWAKAKITSVKKSLGQAWGQQLTAIVTATKRKIPERLRALDLLVSFGPAPAEQLLTQLTADKSVDIRARAARLLFAHRTATSRDALVRLLGDDDPFVRRVACETLTRFGSPAPAEVFVALLADTDRFVAFAARRALEQLPAEQWARQVLDHPSHTAFCQGAVALLAVSPNAQTARTVLPRCQQLLSESQTAKPTATENRLQLDLLRVAQLALAQGQLAPQSVSTLGPALLKKYPSSNDAIDRELVRLLVYLQVPGAAEKFATQMVSDIADTEKIHLGAYAGRLKTGWTTNAKQAFLKFYEVSRAVPGGYSVSAYLENFARDFFAQMTPAESRQIITTGQEWPTSALSLLATLSENPGADLLAELRSLDGRIQPLCAKSDTYRRLRVGILAVLGRSGETESLAYLRDIYNAEPAQRTTVAIVLAQHPQGENWAYLVDAIKTVEGRVAHEVLRSLATVAERPKQPEPYRQVILLGLRLGNNGAPLALNLLDHWSGQKPQANSGDWQKRLAGWQQWYAKHFPGAPPAELPVYSGRDKWSYDELLAYLRTGSGRAGDAQRGQAAFAKAECFKCHRCGGQGETVGPDLTTVAQRFQQQELLGSIVYPSHNISDQYASKLVTSNGRTYTGLVIPRGEAGITLLLSDGEKIDLAHADIDDLQVSRQSVMPTGLLNKLTLSEVADLFAFLENRPTSKVAQRDRAPKKAPTKR
ncbi:MAG: c-type cytochrome [Planctomycetes bacterium]|nr:c-type cytochrome [Planctomycetota bacterium]